MNKVHSEAPLAPLFSPINKIAISLLTITLVASSIIATLGLLGVLPTIAGWTGLGVAATSLLSLMMDLTLTCRSKNASKTSPNVSASSQSLLSLKEITPKNFQEYITFANEEEQSLLRKHPFAFYLAYNRPTSFILYINTFNGRYSKLVHFEDQFRIANETFVNFEELINCMIDYISVREDRLDSIEIFTLHLKLGLNLQIPNPKHSGSLIH